MENTEKESKTSLVDLISKNKKEVLLCIAAVPVIVAVYFLVYQMFNLI